MADPVVSVKGVSKRFGGLAALDRVDLDIRPGEMIGVVDYVSAGYENDPAAAWLELLMIAAPFRSRGLGAEVVRLVEKDIRQNEQVKTICTGTQVDNYGAVRFWQRMGYQIVGEPRVLFGKGCYDLLKILVNV